MLGLHDRIHLWVGEWSWEDVDTREIQDTPFIEWEMDQGGPGGPGGPQRRALRERTIDSREAQCRNGELVRYEACCLVKL